MRMTQQSDYALRMLVYLALKPDQTCTVNEIAEAYGLSRHHLLKVALKMKNLGLVESLRGRSGGINLATDPADINIGALMQSLEGDFALVECMKPTGGCCVISPECRMKGMFHEALGAYLNVLRAYTLADAIGNGAALQVLLQIPQTEEIGSLN